MIAKVFEIFAHWILSKYINLKIVGQEHILENQPFIICANHASHLDSVLLMQVFGGGFRRHALLAAYDYWFENKLRKIFFTKALNLIPVDRREKEQKVLEFTETISRCRSFIQATPLGRIIIFAEGSRSLQSNEIKPGVAILAQSLNLDVIVVEIEGTEKVLPPKSRWFTRAQSQAIVQKKSSNLL